MPPNCQPSMEKRNPCIAMVPCPGFGHLIPLIEFAKRLVVYLPGHFQFTFLIPTLGPPSPAAHSILQSLPPQIEFTILPHVDKNDIPQNAVHPATQIHQTVILSLPSLSQALRSLTLRTQLVAMIADVFSVDALQIAEQFNLKSYVYFPMAVTTLCFCLKFPELDEDDKVSTGFRDLLQPLKLPGCVAFNGKDLFDTVQERSSESYKTILYICKRLHLADGIIVNSFLDLERGAITSLQQSNHNKHPLIYPVGPILKTESTAINESASNCLTWLDNQPQNSVLYVSFGSGGTLTYEQLHELALGLELSRHQFLWVVRPPSGSTSSAYLNSQNDKPLDYLPKGFIERTTSQGLVVPAWAPQTEILRHDSTGGFLTHCGWNSTLESVFYGKPMIVWPLFAEQRMNAVMLTEGFKVALWPKVDENKNGIVVKEEVSRVVKLIMEGDEEGNGIRRRVQVFQDASAKALSSRDGSSAKTISSLAQELKYMSSM